MEKTGCETVTTDSATTDLMSSPLTIAHWNVRTLNSTGSVEIINLMRALGVEVLGL